MALQSHILPSLYSDWLNIATQQQISLVDSIYYECEQHYDAGGDIVVETMDPEDILKEFKSVQDAKEYCGLHVENATNYREGNDNDHEIKRLKDFGEW